MRIYFEFTFAICEMYLNWLSPSLLSKIEINNNNEGTKLLV